jgi:S1-C subfamily serine protease
MPQPTPRDIQRDKFGVAGQDLTAALSRQLELSVDFGVVLTEVQPNGPAAAAGLQQGDVIIQVGPHPVRNLRDAAAALAAVPAGENIFVLIVRENYRAYTRVTIGK